MNGLRCNDCAMIGGSIMSRLPSKLGIQDLDVVLCTCRIRWFGHLEHSTGWIAVVCKLNVFACIKETWYARENMG